MRFGRLAFLVVGWIVVVVVEKGNRCCSNCYRTVAWLRAG